MDMGNEVRVIEVEIDTEEAMPETPNRTSFEAGLKELLEEARRMSREG